MFCQYDIIETSLHLPNRCLTFIFMQMTTTQEIYRLLMAVLSKVDKSQNAILCYNKALSIDEENVEAFVARGAL